MLLTGKTMTLSVNQDRFCHPLIWSPAFSIPTVQLWAAKADESWINLHTSSDMSLTIQWQKSIKRDINYLDFHPIFPHDFSAKNKNDQYGLFFINTFFGLTPPLLGFGGAPGS